MLPTAVMKKPCCTKLLVTVFSGLHFTLVKFLKASVDRQIPQKTKKRKQI